MAKENKNMKPEEIEKKIVDLKIELLKQPIKKKSIKKEIARLLTLRSQTQTKLDSGESNMGAN